MTLEFNLFKIGFCDQIDGISMFFGKKRNESTQKDLH